MEVTRRPAGTLTKQPRTPRARSYRAHVRTYQKSAHHIRSLENQQARAGDVRRGWWWVGGHVHESMGR
ncbi:hypothetical protein HETIRDRAFT_439942 [Heterobasidion irregulare TC 32-1]|uniref:Uncharacterized protein n=1 Tax=Heterobasidion irregulare (strain TC 32-1) TaxID=747525 RepID=W4K706_HETIT|nr:uncharacterized protein HETIRDRAFT_439942 [Heterobasidion irregulare TC 32-1]ETW81534.1 hypothetical protein HETIRDRAFT_439942 [Heterobasidion irregulare TC 32-1]